jgi:4-hydroxybenzoate polyprenyltransferase
MFRKLHIVLEAVKFQHTLFALPFALLSMIYAARGWPAWSVVGWILAAMVGARTAAMAFNRLVDRRLDALNPRTQDRALPRGSLSPGFMAALTAASAGLLVVASWRLNRLCLILSPAALAVVLGYSFTKRFTWLCHFFLGLALAIAPVGAWIGVTGAFDPFPIFLAACVLAWVAGFDILYALLDTAFDRAHGVHSIPARFGERPARRWAALLHLATAAGLAGLGIWARRGTPYFAGCALVAALLLYEHCLASPRDPVRLNRAFFHVNALVGLTLLAAGALDVAGIESP